MGWDGQMPECSEPLTNAGNGNVVQLGGVGTHSGHKFLAAGGQSREGFFFHFDACLFWMGEFVDDRAFAAEVFALGHFVRGAVGQLRFDWLPRLLRLRL